MSSERRIRVTIDGSGARQGAREVKSAFDDVKSQVAGTDNALAKLKSQMMGVFAGLSAASAVNQVVTTFARFEQQIRNVAAASGSTAEEMEKLKRAALDAAAATRYNTEQTGQALYALASAGLSAGKAIATLPNVLNLAEAAQADLGRTTELVTSAMAQFGIAAHDSNRIVDVFTASIGASPMNVDRLAVAMRNAGSTAVAMNQTFEGTVAALNLLVTAGQTGETAGTGLKSAFAQLSTNAVKLGIDIRDSAGNIKPLADIVDELSVKIPNTSQYMEIFGTEAGPTLAALVQVGSDSLREMEKRIASTGQAAEVAGQQIDTLQGDIDQLKSVVEVAFVSLGEMSSGSLRNITQGAAEGVRALVENLDEVVTTAGILASAFTGRMFAGFAASARDSAEAMMRKAQAASAARGAAIAMAQADNQAAAQSVRGATAALAMAKAHEAQALQAVKNAAGTAAMTQRLAAHQAAVAVSARATEALAVAQGQAAATAVALDKATLAATRSATLLAAAGRAVSTAWAFIGGWAGAITIAASAFFLLRDSQDSAEKAADSHAKALDAVNQALDTTKGSAAGAADEVQRLANVSREMAGVKLAEALREQNELIAELRRQASATVSPSIFESMTGDGAVLLELRNIFNSTGDAVTASQDLANELARMAQTDPGYRERALQVQEMADKIAAAVGRVDELRAAEARLGDTSRNYGNVGAFNLKDVQSSVGFVPETKPLIDVGKPKKEVNELANSLKSLRGELDPVWQATDKYKTGLETLNKSLSAGKISTAEYAVLTDELTMAYGENLTVAYEEIEALEKKGDRLQSLIDSLDPVGKATRDFERDLKSLTKAGLENSAVGDELVRRYGEDLVKAYEQLEGPAKESSEMAKIFESAWDEAARGVQRSLKSGFRDALDGNIDSFKDFGKTLLNIAKDVAAEVAAALAIKGIAKVVGGSGSGGWFDGVLDFFGFANGGKISGPGTGTSDSIPIWASNGEYVINAASTAQHENLVKAINDNNPAAIAEAAAGYLTAKREYPRDTMLAHIQPGEAALLEMLGGAGTRNRVTGLYQYGMTDGEAGGFGGHAADGPGAHGGDSDSYGGGPVGGMDGRAGTDGMGADGRSYSGIKGWSSLREMDNRMVDHIDPRTGQGVNRASLERETYETLGRMATPDLADRIGAHVADAFNAGGPGGFGKSDVLGGLLGLAASFLGGPVAGAMANAGFSAYQGKSISDIVGTTVGSLTGAPFGGRIGSEIASAVTGATTAANTSTAGATAANVADALNDIGGDGGFQAISDALTQIAEVAPEAADAIANQVAAEIARLSARTDEWAQYLRELNPWVSELEGTSRGAAKAVNDFVAQIDAVIAGSEDWDKPLAQSGGLRVLTEMATTVDRLAEPASDVEVAVAALSAEFTALSAAITRFGGDGQVAIDALADHMDRLREKTVLSAMQQVWDATGNQAGQFLAINSTARAMRRDLAAVGADTSLADQYEQGALAQILGGEQAAAAAAGQKALVEARQAEIAAIDEQIKINESLVDSFGRLRDELRSARLSLLIDSELSPLSPPARLAEAERQFNDVSSRARLGETAAMEQLPDISRQYLEIARGFYASNEDYARIFNTVSSTLESTETVAERHLNIAQQQLTALSAQADTLEQMLAVLSAAGTARTGGLPNPNANFGANPSLNMALAAATRYSGDFGAGQFGAWVTGQSQSVRDQVNAILAGAGVSGRFRNGGLIGAYANGGLIGNGLYDVDSVIARYSNGGNIALAGGEYVMPAPATKQYMPALEAMRRGTFKGSDNAELVQEIRALRSEIRNVAKVSAMAGDGTIERLERVADGIQRQAREQKLNGAAAA